MHDFRRYDIESGEALTLAAHCGGHYSSPEHIFQELTCSAPVGTGQITLKGELDMANRSYDVPATRKFGLREKERLRTFNLHPPRTKQKSDR